MKEYRKTDEMNRRNEKKTDKRKPKETGGKLEQKSVRLGWPVKELLEALSLVAVRDV